MTIPHFGKREPGSLTAASPGDTLHFAFSVFNDSGNSESLSTTSSFAVTDIEVFKDGLPTARATDSGYSLISDTGQLGDRQGLYRFSVQLYNTADDASFYATGHWYQVAVDSITIDGFTVRRWMGSFEIGRNRVDLREILGDTGPANNLKKLLDSTQTFFPKVDVDLIDGDSGAATHLQQTYANGFSDTGIQGRLDAVASQTNKLTFDTGNEILADIRKVNRITVTGSGDSGADPWGPGT